MVGYLRFATMSKPTNSTTGITMITIGWFVGNIIAWNNASSKIFICIFLKWQNCQESIPQHSAAAFLAILLAKYRGSAIQGCDGCVSWCRRMQDKIRALHCASFGLVCWSAVTSCPVESQRQRTCTNDYANECCNNQGS